MRDPEPLPPDHPLFTRGVGFVFRDDALETEADPDDEGVGASWGVLPADDPIFSKGLISVFGSSRPAPKPEPEEQPAEDADDSRNEPTPSV